MANPSLSPPEAGSEHCIWKLKKCVYGLADASLYWYNKVKETMLGTVGKMTQVDPAVFYWFDEQLKVAGALACHVDDFLWAGSQDFSTNVIPLLKAANIKNAMMQSMHEVNKIIRKLKSETVTLKFQHLGNNDALNLVVFSDASLGIFQMEELNAPSLVCVTDNRSLFDTLKSAKQVTEKRLRLDLSSIKELTQSKEIKEMLWSDTLTVSPKREHLLWCF